MFIMDTIRSKRASTIVRISKILVCWKQKRFAEKFFFNYLPQDSEAMLFQPTQKINLQVASHQPLPLLSNMTDVCKTIFFISPKAGFYW